MLNRGDKVVFIGLRPGQGWNLMPGEHAPEKEVVYTIHEAGIIDPLGIRCCRLVEIVNTTVFIPGFGTMERMYSEDIFRKVTFRSTKSGMEILRKIAAKPPKRLIREETN